METGARKKLNTVYFSTGAFRLIRQYQLSQVELFR